MDPHGKVPFLTHQCSLSEKLVHRYKISHNAQSDCLYHASTVVPPYTIQTAQVRNRIRMA